MTENTAFHSSMVQLLEKYNIEIAPQEKHDVYLLTVQDDLEIHLIGIQKNCLNIACSIADLPDNITQENLMSLLFINAFDLEKPSFQVGIDPQSKIVTLCTRQHWQDLEVDQLHSLVNHFISEAVNLKYWLHSLAEKSEVLETRMLEKTVQINP